MTKQEIILANQRGSTTLGCLGQKRKSGGSDPVFGVKSEYDHGQNLATRRVTSSDSYASPSAE